MSLSGEVLKALRGYDVARFVKLVPIPGPATAAAEIWIELVAGVESLVLALDAELGFDRGFVETVNELVGAAARGSVASSDLEEMGPIALQCKQHGNSILSLLRVNRDSNHRQALLVCATWAYCAGATLAVAKGDRQLEAVCLANLSTANAECQAWKASLDVATAAISADPKYIKAYYRATVAALALKDAAGAKELYELGLTRAGGATPPADYIELELQLRPPVRCVRFAADNTVNVVTYDATDRLFASGTVNACYDSQVFAQLGLPFAMKCLERGTSGKPNNRFATLMMVNPQTGFAPMDWQDGIGDIVVFRRDRRPVSVAEVRAMWDWLCSLTDSFGESGEPPQDYRAHFIEWQFSYNSSKQSEPQSQIQLLVPTKAEQAAWDDAAF